MTAELEGEQEKKNGEKEVLAEAEKTPSPREEEAPANGGGEVKKEVEDDVKSPDDDKTKEEEKKEEDDKQEEDEIIAVTPKRLPFWRRLFGGRQAEKQDIEAGTELLSKESKEVKAEIKPEEDLKGEKNGSGTDVTVAVDEEAGEDEATKKQREADMKRIYWRRVAISLICMMLVLVAVSVVAVISGSGHSSRGPLGDPLAVTDCGPILGFRQKGMYVFKGVPYAMPPVGEMRWRPPMQAASLSDCWNGTYMAFNASALCYQKSIAGLPVSEDCLYLDIITPSLSPPKPRAVVVYIPGQHPMQGHTLQDYEWRPTAEIADRRDVTFVTINYRTNVFGFMVSDVLTNRLRPPTSGNYGIMDMMSALRWVQRNIRNFGGDPERVTVLAHGGAATAALALLSTKKSEKLFSRMWLTSPSARFSNKTLQEISNDNSLFLRKLNCEDSACLYNKTAEEILAATPGFWNADWSQDLPSADDEETSPTMAVIDGYLLHNTPVEMWEEKDLQQVPVVIGAAAQESGTTRKVHDLESWSWNDFTDYVREKLRGISENATEAALKYYVQESSTPPQQFHSMVSDIRTICPLEKLVESLSNYLQADTFWYVVEYQPSSPITYTNDSYDSHLAVHGMDITAIFGIMDEYVVPMTPADITFQKNMQDLFYSFVCSGKPHIRGEGLMSKSFINLIGETIRSRMTPYANCLLWNEDVFFPYAKMN